MNNDIWLVVLDWFDDTKDYIDTPIQIIPCTDADTALELYNHICSTKLGYEAYGCPYGAYIYKTKMATSRSAFKVNMNDINGIAGWSEDERFYTGNTRLCEVIKD